MFDVLVFSVILKVRDGASWVAHVVAFVARQFAWREPTADLSAATALEGSDSEQRVRAGRSFHRVARTAIA